MYERYTAFFHLRAVAGQGAMMGVFFLYDIVLRKQMHASRWEILFAMLVPAIGQLVAVVWNPATSGGPISRHPFRWLGVGVHSLLLLPLLTGGGWSAGAFATLVGGVWLAQMLLIPIQNGILARNYGEAARGMRFGRAVAVQSLFNVGTSVPVGLWLDHDPAAWPVAFGFAAVAGVYCYRQWSRLRRRRAVAAAPGLVEHGSALAVLKKDRTFFAFEGCFMVYGLGFLALQPVLPLFLVDEVGVSYSEVALARNAIFWSVIVLASPWMGRLGDRLGILRLGALGFAALALFPLTLWLLPDHRGLYIAYGLYGLAMCMINITWNLGPLTMARGRDPVPYLNAHVALVGVRAIVGMTAGTLVHRALGSGPVFLGVVALELCAAGLMLWLARTTGRLWRPRLDDPPVLDSRDAG